MKPKLIATLAVVMSLGALSFFAGACAPQKDAESPESEAAAPSSDSSSSSSSSSDSSSRDSSSSSESTSSSLDAPSDSDSPSPRAASSKGEPEKPAKGGHHGIPMPVFPGLKFGMSLEQIAKLNDKDLDGEYKKKFLAASPTQTLEIEDELRDKKAVFRRSRIEFLDTPTGIDQSALKGEYSYANKESLARLPGRIREDGKEVPTRNFFFFNDKLWKVYEEYKLGPKSNLGAEYASAVKKLSKIFGGDPAKVAADYEKGRSFDEAQWNDGEKIIRALDRGDTFGVVFVEKATQDNLAKLRVHQVTDQHEMDKDVKAATANPPTQAGPPKDEKKGDKDKAAKKGAK